MTLTLLYNSLLQHFFTITIFQHFSTMLFSKFLYKNKQKLSSNSSLKSFPPTLLRYTSLQHTFPTHLYLCLLNTLLQHFSTTPFSNSSQQHSSQQVSATLLYNTLFQDFSTTCLSNIPAVDFPSTVRTQQQQSTTPERLPNSTEGLKSLENYLGWIIDYLQLYLISTLCKHVSTGQTIWVLLQRALSTCAIDVAKVCRWSSPPRRLPGWTGMTHDNASWRQPKIMLRHTVWSCCTKIGYLQHMPIL